MLADLLRAVTGHDFVHLILHTQFQLLQTMFFHFVFGLTLLPRSVQFPLLRLAGKRSVMHYLRSDIRGKTPAQFTFTFRWVGTPGS